MKRLPTILLMIPIAGLTGLILVRLISRLADPQPVTLSSVGSWGVDLLPSLVGLAVFVVLSVTTRSTLTSPRSDGTKASDSR